MISNCMWDISKLFIQICFSFRFEEGRGEGCGCLIAIFEKIDCFIDLKYPSSSLTKTYFVYFLPVFLNWLYQSSLAIILVLGCNSKFSVDPIQTGHMDLLPLQA